MQRKESKTSKDKVNDKFLELATKLTEGTDMLLGSNKFEMPTYKVPEPSKVDFNKYEELRPLVEQILTIFNKIEISTAIKVMNVVEQYIIGMQLTSGFFYTSAQPVTSTTTK